MRRFNSKWVHNLLHHSICVLSDVYKKGEKELRLS